MPFTDVTLSGSVLPSAAAQTINVTAPLTVVTEGASIQFSANLAVTWSLAPGSKGTINPTTGIYTAPVQLTAKSTVGGCPTAPNDSVFNTPIDNAPLNSSSAYWISGLAGMGINYEQAWGLSTYDSSTPTVSVHLYYANIDETYPMPSWPHLRKEAGNFSTGYGNNTDHHITAADVSNCGFFDMYDYTPIDSQHGNATSAVKYSGTSYALPGGSDAAGLLLSPLTLHLSELENGHINHALRFSMSNNDIVPAFVWPATNNAYPYSVNMLPYGTRLRLNKSFVNANINMSSLSPMAQALITQLELYGIILTDGGNYVSITTDMDVRQDPAAILALNQATSTVNGLGGMSAFEVVDESSMNPGDGTSAVNVNNAAAIIPEDYAIVIATSEDGSITGTQRVSLEGVGIGVDDSAIVVPAGATVQMHAWTTGTTSNSNVVWDTTTSQGTITASGSFTAPWATAPTTTTLTVRSVENRNASQVVKVSIVPTGLDGALRLADRMGPNYFSFAFAGNRFGPDASGNMWWPDTGYFHSSYDYCDWGSSEGSWCGLGPDNTHDLLVPQGNYKITFYIGLPQEGGNAQCGSGAPAQTGWNFGAQGQWAVLNFDAIAATQNCTQSVTVSIPAAVDASNRLSFTASNILVNQGAWNPFRTFVSVAPDSTPPHLAISDAAGNTSASTVLSNTRMQFSAVAWYMPNSVTWSVYPSIGTIDQNGVYTAPTVPTTANVTVTATSTTDFSKAAAIAVHIIPGSLTITSASPTVPRSLNDQFFVQLNGNPYSNVTWSASQGAVQPSGLYTAPDNISVDQQVIITATSTDNPSLSSTYGLTVQVNNPPIRINAGDWYTQYTIDANGNYWYHDCAQDANGNWICPEGIQVTSSGVYHASPFVINGGIGVDGQPINPSASMASVYNSSRYAAYAAVNQFSYTFTLPNGTYQVTTLFGNYGSVAHTNLFNVIANGTKVVSNYDPDSVGLNYGTNQSFNVVVTHKTLTLTFVGNNGKSASVNGIQILPASPEFSSPQ